MKNIIKDFLLDIFFPKFCLNCQKEGELLCEDCKSLFDISEYHFCLCQKPNKLPQFGKCPKCRSKSLSGLYFVLPYQNNLVKNLIQKFKYEPFVKELAVPLSNLILTYFQLMANPPSFSGFILIPIPLTKKRLKWRGFNQAEEIGKIVSKSLNIPLVYDVLIKIKENSPQMKLNAAEREKNILGVFACKNEEKIQGKKILLVDDVYTTGATMEEAAKVLKTAGAKEVWGLVVARG